MDTSLRSSIRKSFGVALLVVALGVGFVAHGSLGSKTARPAAKSAPTNITKAQLLAAAAAATAGIYLQFDGITGPPLLGHGQHISISSFQLGVGRSATISNGNREASTPSVSEITVTKTTDKASAALFNASVRGAGGGNAVIYFSKLNTAGKIVNYLEFDLTGALVTGYSLSSGGDTPSEAISLNFTAITMKAQFDPGSAPVSWDLLTNS